MSTFNQPYVALLGVGGTIFTVLLSLLLNTHDPKTAVVVVVGIAVAQLTKSATSFGQGAPNSAMALFVCVVIGIIAGLGIVGVNDALEAMKENGLAMKLTPLIGLYAALLGAAQDRPKDQSKPDQPS